MSALCNQPRILAQDYGKKRAEKTGQPYSQNNNLIKLHAEVHNFILAFIYFTYIDPQKEESFGSNSTNRDETFKQSQGTFGTSDKQSGNTAPVKVCNEF